MGILDIFSGRPGRDAAIWGAGLQQQGLDQQRGYLGQGAKLGLAELGQGYQQGRTDVRAGYGGGLDTLKNTFNPAAAALRQNPATIRQYANQADRYYQPLAAGANRGFSAYGDAAGVNGAAGQDRARSNFRAGPGYNFMVNQGVNAATRAANASGMAASGNTLDATTRLGANLADQQWDDYMSRLSPYLNMAPQIAGQRAGIAQHAGDALTANNKSLADLYTGYGKDRAAAQLGQGTTLASMATGYGSNQAGIYGDLSRNLSNVTGAAIGQQTQLGTAGMMAGQAANQNAWDAGMQIAKLVAQTAGKASNPFA
jgi:hypothetical protein